MSNLPYHLPVRSQIDLGFIRSPGPGFGNLLFPIARVLVGQKTIGGTFVEPTLRQIKFGTYMHNEKDKRSYSDVFKPRSNQDLTNWARARLRRKRSEYEVENEASVICYQGLGRQFHDIRGQSSVVKDYLKKISQYPLLDMHYDVAIHVRLGDFAPPRSGVKLQNTQIPLEWYGMALNEAKRLLKKKHVRGVLFSDGDPQKVIEQLRLEGFEPEPLGNALSSIFTMSQARLLIGSRSTFSLWGQYLGESMAIWPDSFELSRYKPVDPNNDFFV